MIIMPGLAVVLALLLVTGVALALFPVEPTIRRLLIAIIVIVVLLWLLSMLGVLPAVRFR